MRGSEPRPKHAWGRRDFLARCCRGVAAFPLLPALPKPFELAENGPFHLHPHYRSPAPTDLPVTKIDPGFDNFILEKDHNRIAAVLEKWSSALRQSPPSLQAIQTSCAPDFRGASLQASHVASVRNDPHLRIERLSFSDQPSLESGAFLTELRSSLSNLSNILTAEFQVTKIDSISNRLRTRIRYELVGSGPGFHREQRIGWWECEWGAEDLIYSWIGTGELRSRASAPCFVDITGDLFHSVPSYTDQLLRGVDHWRSTIDGACGIDLYGHNGVSVGDIDGNGFDDLYVCQPAGLPNRLYRNRGDGTLEDITAASGVGILDNTSCALFIDIDNDGHQDLVVVRANGPLLFINQGNGTFRHKPDAFQFATTPKGTFTGAAAADYNRDGRLDIYFCLYAFYRGTGQYKYPVPYFAAENGPPNFLMHNNGDGTFTDVTVQSGLQQNNTRFSFCCGWSDYNQDGWPDLYVVNDFGRKNLYRNNGDGTFTDVAGSAGTEDVGAGMSVCRFDYNGDGAEDLYVANMWTAAGERISNHESFKTNSPEQVQALYRKHAMGNSLLRNQHNGTFEDVTKTAAADIGRWSWSSDALDFDHDGFPDLYVSNGMISGPIRKDLNSFFWRQVVANSPDDSRSAPAYEQGWNALNELIRSDYTWSGFERNNFFANNRDGTFSDVSAVAGLDFSEDARAFAIADFDHDGRQEIFLKNRNAPQLRVLKNVMKELPPSIVIRLRGTKSNRDAIGAVVSIESGSSRQTKTVQAGSGFLSQHSKDLFFGLGDAKAPLNVSIRWPSGLTQHVGGVPANHRIAIVEGSEQLHAEPFQTAREAGAAPLAPNEEPPARFETWLLVPLPAPDFSNKLAEYRGKPVLLHFSTQAPPPLGHLLPALAINPDAPAAGMEEVIAIYNLTYRYLFDRHRDLPVPSSFLLDENSYIVKLYQGPLDATSIERDIHNIPRTREDRLAKALPFPGVSDTYEFTRNHLALGAVFFQRGYLEQAGRFFQSALKDNPASSEACYGIGSVYLSENRTKEARQSFEQALNLTAGYSDTHPNAWNNLGLLAMREGQTDEATRCFQESLKISPHHFVSLENLGNAYRQQKRWNEAREMLQQASAINPDDPETNYSLGMLYAQTGKPDDAYTRLKRALNMRPNYPEALNNLGILCLKMRREPEAIDYFEKSILIAPDFDQSYLNLARVYVIEGKPSNARAVLNLLLKRHPDHTQALQMLEQLH
ncbi:MAG TPA: FG-GAP-like repeat-containing protein [Bryobacteraceae bacterium]|nr:FG-GAP-like repeat-containing protein [Bryobacteraceae bacterium]